MKNMTKKPANMVRCLITLTGIVAVSGNKTCTAPKATAHRPKNTNSTTMRQSLQAYSLPPHCSARMKHTMAGMKKRVPKGSRRVRCFRGGTDSRVRSGDRWKRYRQTTATAPMGRFM